MAQRYALFSARYAPLKGGVESFTAHVASALVRAGDEVTVVTSRVAQADPAWEIQADGVEVCRLPSIPAMNARLPLSFPDAAYRASWTELTSRGFDRVLVNTRFYPHSLEGLRLAHAIGAQAVVLDHGAAYLTFGNKAADVCLHLWERALTALGRRYRPTYAGVSEASCAWLAHFGITTRHVIPDAIDAEAYRAQASGRAWRQELAIPEGSLLVAFVGRLEPEKGALALAEAAKLLGGRFHVALCGAGSQERAIRALNQANVHLLGTLPSPDVSALFAQADLFCLPSRSEGFCLSFLEAAAWGLASVTTRAGIMGEVSAGPAGFGRLIDNASPVVIAEAISACADAHILGHSQGLADHIRERYSWEASAAALASVFDEA